jgi:chaperonin GroEL (HSP60 family)
MDRILKEERQYLLNICKKIKKSGCNVLFIQKSILRDAVNDLSLHFLAKLNILAVKEIEREEVEFICKVMSFLRRALGASQLLMLNRLQKINWDMHNWLKKLNQMERGI